MKIHGWGRYPIIDAKVLLPKDRFNCLDLINSNEQLIARGLGRSYGDSANSSTVLQTNYLDHYIKFDEVSGQLSCEAGISLNEILKLIVPKGWFIPVTPGSSHISIGGAIASDVHGKNHHLSGTFSEHILSLHLLLGTGEIVTVSRNSLEDLFKATCGGMGLTGVILSATIQLKPIQSSRIIQRTLKANSLEEVCDFFDQNNASTYSVAWIDCLAKGARLGRSLLMLGEHAQDGIYEVPRTRTLNMPINLPPGILNQYSIKAFNALFYNKQIAKSNQVTLPFDSYFYPLDAIENWNRLYGKAGFFQYQFVLPKSVGMAGLKKILNTIAYSGRGSFLAVLKIFGKANDNLLTFPMEGYTLALDFKVCDENLLLAKELDAMVTDIGGKVYLAKDALISEPSFKTMYPQWEHFEEVRAKYGAIGKFSSNQSKRLGLL